MQTTIDLNAVVRQVRDEVAPLVGTGKVADYIPALACVPIDRFGIAVQTTDGDFACAGDADVAFSIQSISKVLTLTLALEARGDSMWKRVGKEPSGDPFNSLLQLEHECGIPRNPLINAGALVVADCLVTDCERPLDTLLARARSLANAEIQFDLEVAASELATADRNAAMAHLMKSFGNLENDVSTVLETYCHQCALAMSCRQLASAFSYLAGPKSADPNSAGSNSHPAGAAVGPEEARVVSVARARRINALMLTCGTYDRAGEFAFEVGLPAKSGVGGGIVAVIPGRGTVAVWSPGLGDSGNSVAGIDALKRFVALTGWSVF